MILLGETDRFPTYKNIQDSRLRLLSKGWSIRECDHIAVGSAISGTCHDSSLRTSVRHHRLYLSVAHPCKKYFSYCQRKY